MNAAKLMRGMLWPLALASLMQLIGCEPKQNCDQECEKSRILDSIKNEKMHSPVVMVANQAREAAEKGLVTLKQIIGLSNFREMGFDSLEEIKTAEVVEGPDLVWLGCTSYRTKERFEKGLEPFVLRRQKQYWVQNEIETEEKAKKKIKRCLIIVDSSRSDQERQVGAFAVNTLGKAGTAVDFDSALTVLAANKINVSAESLMQVEFVGLGISFWTASLKPDGMVLPMPTSQVPCFEDFKKPMPWRTAFSLLDKCAFLDTACTPPKAQGAAE